MAHQDGPMEPKAKDVMLHTYRKDKYGRTLGDVLLEDATNADHALVKEGWCWWYRKFAGGYGDGRAREGST